MGLGGKEETKTPTTPPRITNNDDAATESSAEDAALVNVVGPATNTTMTVENEPQLGEKEGTTVKNNRTTISANTATTQQEQEQPTPMVVLSACLLLKDDNDILNEWVAYHYHLWNLRHLVVAVDPSSRTSPAWLLEPWNKTTTLLEPLTVQLWKDQDYMPADFLQGDYSRVPQRQGQLLTKLQHENTTTTTTTSTMTVDLQGISNHRYRQRQFYRQCINYFHTHQHQQHHEHRNTRSPVSWIAHIDTDEYLALNPWKLENEEEVVFRPTAGSMMQVLESQTRPACFAVPRLLFGSREEPDTTTTTIQQQQQQPSYHDDKKNHHSNNDTTISSFESLRWKYHASYEDTTRNGHPKALLDWRIWKGEAWKRRRNTLLQKVYSIHRPLAKAKICPKEVSFVGTTTDIAIHHYLGSLQRYLSREDPRRSQEVGYASSSSLFLCPRLNLLCPFFSHTRFFTYITHRMSLALQCKTGQLDLWTIEDTAGWMAERVYSGTWSRQGGPSIAHDP